MSSRDETLKEAMEHLKSKLFGDSPRECREGLRYALDELTELGAAPRVPETPQPLVGWQESLMVELRRALRRITDYRGDHRPNCDCPTCNLVRDGYGLLDSINTAKFRSLAEPRAAGTPPPRPRLTAEGERTT